MRSVPHATGGAWMSGLVRAAHLGPTVAVTAFTATVAFAAGAGTRSMALAGAVCAGQLSVGWCNDYLDRALDVVANRRDKPIATGDVGSRVVGVAAVAALIVAVIASLAVGLAAGLAHCVALAAAWAYNLRLKRTVASPLPFLVAFALVPPCFVSLTFPGSPLPDPSLVAASGLLGMSAHFTNTIKDTYADRATQVRGLPQRLGPTASAVVSALLVAAAATILLAFTDSPATVSAVAAGGAVALAAAYCALVASGSRTAAAFALNIAAVAGVLVAYLTVGGNVLAGRA